jgi:hypothetical protein
MKKYITIFALFCFQQLNLYGQIVDLSKMLDEELNTNNERNYTTATFKTTRLVNGHTNEQDAAGVLDFRIGHRFGAFNTGVYNFFGLDQATMRMALEYGINNWLMVGGGRSTYQKTYDGFAKAKLFRQQTGKKNFPISVNYLIAMAVKTLKFTNPENKNYYTSNFFYTHQLIIARKFSESFSLQLAPTLVHRNLVEKLTDKHDIFAVGIGGRMKLTKRACVNVEYYYQVNKPRDVVNSLAIAFDIETGGHVFQLTFTNAAAMIEHAFITQTTGKWSKGDIIGGFNLSRVFTLKDPRKRGTKNEDLGNK